MHWIRQFAKHGLLASQDWTAVSCERTETADRTLERQRRCHTAKFPTQIFCLSICVHLHCRRKDTKAMSNGWIMDNKEDSNGNSERVELFCWTWIWIQNCLLQHCGVCPTSCYDTTITQAGQLLLRKSKTKTLKGALWSYKITTLWPRPRPKSNHKDAQQRSSSDKMFTSIKWKTEEN